MFNFKTELRVSNVLLDGYVLISPMLLFLLNLSLLLKSSFYEKLPLFLSVFSCFKWIKGSKAFTKDKVTRKENGIFEKWELVTSHIGRRSFATNNYGKIPTSLIRQLVLREPGNLIR